MHQTGNNASRKKYIFFSFFCIVQKVLAALITSTELHNSFTAIYKYNNYVINYCTVFKKKNCVFPSHSVKDDAVGFKDFFIIRYLKTL
jgi:hypothetical protein